MKEASDHEKKLARAYTALSNLRRHSEPVSVTAVAEEAGVARSTIYGKHPEWQELLEVITKNKPSPRIEVAEVELTEARKWELQLGQLRAQVKEIGQSVLEARNQVDDVYDKLLAELHKYFILAKETPQQRAQRAEMAKDFGNLSSRLDSVLAENRQLQAEKGLPGNVVGFLKKEVIEIYPAGKRSNLLAQELNGYCYDAINVLDGYFKVPEFAPKCVYLMCGQFASGKSRWIRNHKPMVHGTVLYIDGTNHTSDMRSLFVKRLRGLAKDCRIDCCRVFATLDECLGRNGDEVRKRTQTAVPEALLRHVAETFVEVAYHEGFDAIELVGECK